MLTQIQGPDRHFSAFYKDNAILIQFMIDEFIRSHQLIFQIKTLIQKHLDSIQGLKSLSISLIQILGQLIGSPSQHEHCFQSSWTKGSLTKFKEYSEQFSRNSDHQNKQYVNLQNAAQQAWMIAVNNFEFLSSLSENSYPQNPPSMLFLHPLERAFNRLQRSMHQISRYIPRITSAYWNNENVILYIVRRKSALEEIYGSNFFYKSFKLPMKMHELIEMLIKRYQARGFESLLPTIQYLFEEREMASSIS